MVFSKVGASELSVILSISCLALVIAASKAGLKCSFFILEKGGVLKGVLNFSNNGFVMFILNF